MNRKLASTFAPAALLGLSLALAAAPAGAPLDAAKSSVVATFKQEGVAVDSPFKKFSGTIVYDAKNPAGASAALEVDMSSLDIGDEAYNAEVRKKAWFDSATYPKATFQSTAIKAGAAGHFTATGTLTIKGKSAVINVPVTVQSTPAGSSFDGSFAISRKGFGIGDPVWDDVLEDAVTVKFHLVSAAK